MYCKYTVETKRLFGGWSRGAIWSVALGNFRKFLDYINGCDNHFGVETRIKRIRGGVSAEYNFPEDGLHS